MSEQQAQNCENTAEAKKEPKAKKSSKDAKYIEKITQLESEIALQKDTYLRLCAEYDNFRKRTAKEKLDTYANATAKAVEALLPVVDNFDRALISQGENADEGLKMIHTQLFECLEKLGVTKMKVEGEKFDPNLSIAVMHIDDEAFGENTVVEVFQQGYMLGEKVIRPACVKVAN